MFDSASAFNQNLSSWDVSNATTLTSMFTGATLSTANYDALLNGWSALTLQPNVAFNVGNSKYCLGETARTSIEGQGWTIYDGGLDCGINLQTIVYLQGASMNPNNGEENLMRDDLRVAGVLPTTSPYTDALTCSSNVFNTTGQNAIVDWIWLELRDKIDGITVIASTSALIQRDGDIVDVDGVSPLTFPSITPNDYYIVVSHLNHLGIISNNAVNISGITTVDLSSDSSSVSGGLNAIKDMGNGKFALFAGDFNGDGQVQNTDKNAVERLLGISGYSHADLDMNGEVQNTDLNSVLNPNLGKGEQYTGKKLFANRIKK
jgi:surface protein